MRTAIHLLLTCLARACVHVCRSTAAQDYCQWDTFEASCGRRDELVVMRTAVYGRMTSGRCIERDYGYVGCQTDVLLHADLSCSGRRQCSLNIPYQPFGVAHPCPRDLTLFLRASFECVKGNNNKLYIRSRPFYRAMLCISGTSRRPVSVRVRPCPCPSQSGVLLKRLNVRSHKQHHTIAQGL